MPRQRKFPHVLSNKHGRVTVYKTRNGPYESFKIVWKEGKHRRKESRPDEPAAVSRGLEILDDLSNGAAARKDATATQWAYFRKCQERLGDIPLHVAVDFYLEHGLAQKPEADTSVRDVLDRFYEAKKSANKSDRYLETVKYHLEPLVSVLRKPFGMVKVGDLDAHLSTIADPRTRLNHRRTLVTLWRWAKTKGLLSREKETAAELTDVPEVTPKDPEIITPDELEEVIRAAETKEPALVPYLALAAFAGIRSAEICRMTWEEHIDLDRGVVVLGSDITKKRRRRVIHMEPVLVEWLETFKGSGRVVRVESPHEQLRRVRTKPWPHNALRHSAVSYLMAVHRNAAMVADQCGHTEAELQASYKAAATADQAGRWFTIKPQNGKQHEHSERTRAGNLRGGRNCSQSSGEIGGGNRVDGVSIDPASHLGPGSEIAA